MHQSACHINHSRMRKRDIALPLGMLLILISYASHSFFPNLYSTHPLLLIFNANIFELMNKMWWGIGLGVLVVGFIGVIPKEIVTSALGKGGTFSGILRATGAGVMLDLCSHGILLVGMKLYERGASLGQVMAFLIASPWNSISLTLILWSLIGFKWMIAILLLSLIIALISGTIFDRLVAKGVLPPNPNKTDIPEDYVLSKELVKHFTKIRITPLSVIRILRQGLKDSTMILKWIFFGIVLASVVRTFVNPEFFAVVFGPRLIGLGATLLFATILEVCSEGSIVIATDMLLKAKAAGNTFAFMMVGVSTDYTEIVSLRERTGSWKIAFFLPLITLPQVVLISIILNNIST